MIRPHLPKYGDPHGAWSDVSTLPPACLEGPLDMYGCPEILRYEINRMLSRAYHGARQMHRRVVRLRLDFDTIDVPFEPELHLRAWTVPAEEETA